MKLTYFLVLFVGSMVIGSTTCNVVAAALGTIAVYVAGIGIGDSNEQF